MTGHAALDPQAVVIFGASGDLTKRKLLPAFYHLFVQGLLPRGFAVVGFSRTGMDDEEFREMARGHIRASSDHAPEGQVWEDFRNHLSYVAGDVADAASLSELTAHLAGLDERLGTQGRRFFYAATPPSVYPSIVQAIWDAGLAGAAKLVLEKPFGHEVDSARELNRMLHRVFDERQIFRIDHYLGKETVQNILAFRFANGMFEPIWNRDYIDHVQISVAEEIGIEGRGAFYEQVGNIRDMISTHLFQVMTFVAMEPPAAFDPERLRDETVKVLHSAIACRPDRVVRGQYRGYLEEDGVDPESTVETFSAMEVHVDNWRWAGVPFYLRTGKRLARKMSEITLKFRHVPFNVFKGSAFGHDVDPGKRDHLTIRIQPNEGITLAVNAKQPGPGMHLGRVTMEFDYDEDFPHHEILDAYELLLLEAMRGDHSLFVRQDGVERAWELLQPVLDRPTPVVRYEPGTWGPAEADALIAPRKWHVTEAAGPADHHGADRRS